LPLAKENNVFDYCSMFDLSGKTALVVGTVLYLASGASSYVTGSCVLVDGGRRTFHASSIVLRLR